MIEQRFGPLITDEGVRFRLWAPGATEVRLLIEDTAHQLHPVGEGFFEVTVRDAGPGTRYRFRRDDGPDLPDPASRWQPEGVHGPSEVLEIPPPRDTNWLGRPPEELVIYELHVGTFTCQGGYRGVLDRLDHLADLGVTAVELMPLAAFPGSRGWGYDGVFHFAPFRGYGHPRELPGLVDACHQRGIAVILDLVTNHFGPEGNSMWSLAPDFFRPDRPTSWSAGHAWRLDQVKRYFDEAALHWIRTYGMDGLRLDAFHAVPPEVRGEHLSRMVRIIDEHLCSNEPEREVLVLLESIDNQASLLRTGTPKVRVTQLNFDFQRAGHALLTGERHGEYRDFGDAERELGRCLEDGFAFRGRWNSHCGRVIGDGGKPASWGELVNYLQNHDTCGNRHLGQRLDALVDEPRRLEAATALLLLHPAIPFLFMGQEWGARTPFHFFTDFPDALGEATQSGRLRLFREMGPGPWEVQAPGCQEPAAFARSVLCWDELDRPAHRKILDRVREALAARRQIVGQMSRDVSEVELQEASGLFVLRIPAREPERPAFLLCANLGDEPADRPAGELLFATRGCEDTIPPATTCLLRLASLVAPAPRDAP
jgi:malto-oligosyltrehalose trehalohydrolase